MINGRIATGVAIICLLVTGVFGSPTQITYQVTSLGLGRWQYNYDVTNVSLTSPIEEFTIWFDYTLYDGLAIETPDPPASDWDELIISQPDPKWSIDGGYDALAESWNPGINIGQTVSGFSVSFDWLGTGEPGSQLYEIVNPDTYDTIESGRTIIIPAPGALILTVIGLSVIRFREKHKAL